MRWNSARRARITVAFNCRLPPPTDATGCQGSATERHGVGQPDGFALSTSLREITVRP
jgi:hypothetical protein